MRMIARPLAIIFLTVLTVGCGKGKKDDPAPPPIPSPSITRFSPLADTIGATVTIYGAHFDPSKSNNDIKFNGVAATVLTASTDSLTTTVPATTSTGKISVTVKGKTAESATAFTVLYAPYITTFSPFADTVGATVTIKGKNFGTTADKNMVYFPATTGTVQAQIITASDTQLVVKVPATGGPAAGKISVKVNNYEAQSSLIFYAVVPPVITAFTPFTAPVGTVVTLTGSNLGQYFGTPFSVRFNGVEATQYERFINSINVVVPAGATTGKVSVTIGTATGHSTTDFVVSSQLWKRKKDFVSGRSGMIGFSIGSKAYIGMGRDFNNVNTFKDLWEYDPVTDQWSRKADIPGAGKWLASSFVVNGKGYVVGGENNNGSGHSYETWEYDPVNDKWTQKLDFPWYYILPTAFSVGNKGYFGLGDHKDVWEFDPMANTWTQIADFPGTERQGAMSFTIGNKAYIACGTHGFVPRRDLWEFNPATGNWTQKADFPGTPRYSGAGFSIDNYGYIGLGETGALGPWLKDLWEYNPATNSWTRKLDLPATERGYPFSFPINGKAYIGAGYTPYVFYKDWWEFTP